MLSSPFCTSLMHVHVHVYVANVTHHAVIGTCNALPCILQFYAHYMHAQHSNMYTHSVRGTWKHMAQSPNLRSTPSAFVTVPLPFDQSGNILATNCSVRATASVQAINPASGACLCISGSFVVLFGISKSSGHLETGIVC